ncbi:hypothetical protein B0H17DRAFT_1205244 [Mycena rosella]|uniref:Uncharacterized protein n=1 Tax=Mycena rosella TaxID=1033263 RepID=A0AAD7DAX1_MYCRO|nr:hypothetical protein B0H17DRAFT_1205244 [Mycena rosella]
MLFSKYATPAATLRYSPQYLASLTFSRVDTLDYPQIKKSGLIQGWCFSNEAPATASGTLIQPGELIPCLQDLLPISQEMEQAFDHGSRSVDVILNDDSQMSGVRYHFSNIYLLIAINNYRSAIDGVHSLYHHIIANNLLSSNDLKRFGDLRIDTPICSFQVTAFALWKLACLLGETWLEEDIVNALLEIIYFHEAMQSSTDPLAIILPTSFAMTWNSSSNKPPDTIVIISISFAITFGPFPLPPFRL